MRPKNRHTAGFSLIEISIVLAVVSTMLAGVLPAITESLKARDSNTTVDRMQAIQEALMSHYTGHGQLPCPANLGAKIDSAEFGTEAENLNCAGGTPSANFLTGFIVGGAVPTKTLGLPDDYGFDGWGRRLEYHVDYRATTPASFRSAGGLRINDISGNARSQSAVYVVLSHGANGHGGYTRAGTRFVNGSQNKDELLNCDCNPDGSLTKYNGVFVQRMSVAGGGDLSQTFDDVVYYKNASAFPKLGDTREPPRAAMAGFTEAHISGTSFNSNINFVRGGSLRFLGGTMMNGGVRQRIRFEFDEPMPSANYYIGGNGILVITRDPAFVEFWGCMWKNKKCSNPNIEIMALF